MNPYEKNTLCGGYGTVGKIAQRYLAEKKIQVLGIVDEGKLGNKGNISKEECLRILAEDKNIIVFITTIAYYAEIRDYLFNNLKRRQYIDFQHFMVQVQNYEFSHVIEKEKKDVKNEDSNITVYIQ